MRAIRYYGPGDIRLEEIPEPQAGEKQIKIKVAWNGICGSDLHSYFSILPPSPTAVEPHVVTNETLPIVMGHEMSGTVAELGPGADTSRFRVGQKVVVEPLLSCRKSTCPFCSDGTRNLCRHATFHGIGGWGGGLSEYISVYQEQVFPVPDWLPLDVAALVEPISVAWHAVKRSNLKAGDRVLVIGTGPIGLLVLRVARVFGAAWVAVSEPASARRDLAKEQGADAVYDPTALEMDVVAEIHKMTEDRGADVVFDCAGTQRTLDTAFQTVRPRGTIMNVAVWESKPELDIDSLTFKEVTLTSVLGFDRVHADVVRAVGEGKFKGIESLITRRISLEEFVEKGIKALLHEKDRHVKIIVSPTPLEEFRKMPRASL
ncbi:GroES-like protein [Fomes fomentarius]|nr:GroES-like protein [Fomes fomentarius]